MMRLEAILLDEYIIPYLVLRALCLTIPYKDITTHATRICI